MYKLRSNNQSMHSYCIDNFTNQAWTKHGMEKLILKCTFIGNHLNLPHNVIDLFNNNKYTIKYLKHNKSNFYEVEVFNAF